ncbi:carboxypeptidase-like regulatory domain-containing protein [Streptomyces sp. NPDC088354]|uniref:carboxypeptidase-like regulatory domain-containing protein n=1 Tax=Streptomyces sp. NPDC088354 TaxID=3365856 RepID=UPI0037F13021
MPVESRRLLALIASVAALSGGLAVAPALAADAGPLGIGVARTVDTQRGSFTVPVWTDAPGGTVTSVTATVRDGDAVVVDGLRLAGSGEQWSVPSDAVLKLTEDGGVMPHLGRYAIDVTATDDQGDTVVRTGAGTLDFTLRPVLTTALTRTLLDRDHRTAGVTGTLLGVQPGSGDEVPLEGATVGVTRTYYSVDGRPDSTGQAVTGADGSFVSPEFPVVTWAGLSAAFSADDAQVHGTAQSAAGNPQMQQTNVVVTAKADRTRAVSGQAVTISGTVKDTTGTPVAGASVRLALGAAQPVTVVTGATGSFSGKVVAARGQNDWGGWSAAEDDPYLTASAAASGSILLPADSVFTEVTSRIGADVKVTVSARLFAAYDRVTSIYDHQFVHLEYSKDGKSGWKDLGTGYAPDNGGTVTISKWGYLDGYYRLHHYTSDQLAETASKPVRLTRTNTRLYSMKASSTKVKKGAAVTFTGTLKEYVSGTWRPYRSGHVELFFQKKGSTKWTYISSGTTNSTGKATLKGKPASDGKWLIQYFGDAKHFDSDGTAVFVDVR